MSGKEDDQTIGLAFISGICDPTYKTSLVHFQQVLETIYVIAHEIGHRYVHIEGCIKGVMSWPKLASLVSGSEAYHV